MENEGFQQCCPAWATAHEDGTDSEMFGPLVCREKGRDYMGLWLPAVDFCPWCGARKGNADANE